MSDLKAAGEFLENKGINLTNYAIFDTSGDFLQQIPIATWLNEFAEQQANKPTKSTEPSIVNEPVLCFHYLRLAIAKLWSLLRFTKII